MKSWISSLKKQPAQDFFYHWDIKDIHELCLASEGMVVYKFWPPSILSAVDTLLGSFYCFNMEFPMGIGGSEKTCFCF